RLTAQRRRRRGADGTARLKAATRSRRHSAAEGGNAEPRARLRRQRGAEGTAQQQGASVSDVPRVSGGVSRRCARSPSAPAVQLRASSALRATAGSPALQKTAVVFAKKARPGRWTP